MSPKKCSSFAEMGNFHVKNSTRSDSMNCAKGTKGASIKPMDSPGYSFVPCFCSSSRITILPNCPTSHFGISTIRMSDSSPRRAHSWISRYLSSWAIAFDLHINKFQVSMAARSDEPMQLFQNLGKFFVRKTVHHVGKPRSETDYIFPDVLLLNNDIANQ